MPRSKNQTHKHWDIDDPHGYLTKESKPRRLVEKFQTHDENVPKLSQAEAVARLIEAGYEQLVSTPLPPKLHGPNPHGATDGSSTLDKQTMEESQE